MHHIEIYVSNLDKTKEFYSWIFSILGFELFQEWKDGFSYKKDEFYIVFVQTKEKYLNDVSMILWTRFGRIVSNQRRCPNESKIYQRVQGNNCSIT